MPRISLIAVLLTFAATNTSWSQQAISVLEPTSMSGAWVTDSNLETGEEVIVEQPVYPNGPDGHYEVISSDDGSSSSWWSPLTSLKQRFLGRSESTSTYSESYSMGEEVVGSMPNGEMPSNSPIQFVDEESGQTFIVGADGVARPASANAEVQGNPSSPQVARQPYTRSMPSLTLDNSYQAPVSAPQPYVPWYAKLNPFRSRSYELTRSEAWATPTASLTASRSPQINPPAERPTTQYASRPSTYNIAATKQVAPSTSVKHTQPSYGYSRMPSYDSARSIAATTPKSSEIRPSYQATWQNPLRETTGGVRRSPSFNGLESYSNKATATASRPIFTNGRYAR